MKKLVLLVLVIFFALSAIGAQDYDSKYEKKTEIGIRLLGSYSFSDSDNDDFFGDDVSSFAIGVIFPTDNPNVSWRVSYDSLTASGSEAATIYIDASNYGYLSIDDDLTIGGFSGAVVFHSAKAEKVRFYGGLGFGFYSAEEDMSMSGYVVVDDVYVPLVVSETADGDGTGLNFFVGANCALSPSVSVGLEYNIKKLKIDMSSASVETTSVDYGGNGTFIVLSIGF